jgi:hypothetical protein
MLQLDSGNARKAVVLAPDNRGGLLVEELGVGGGGRDVGVTGGVVGAGCELVCRLQVGIAGGAVGDGVTVA